MRSLGVALALALVAVAATTRQHATAAASSVEGSSRSSVSVEWGYAAQRAKAAGFLQGRFDPGFGLLKGVWAGGHGYETLGYSLIDVNFFAQHSLQPYNAAMAGTIAAATAKYLLQANYSAGEDRREGMFGKLVPEILTVDTVTVEGGYPAPPHRLWMVTEKVNRSRRGYTPDRPYGVNVGVTMALSRHLAGDTDNATRIMRTIASWWNVSTRCIMEPAAVVDGFCYTRALAYFLFGARALRLPDLLPQTEMKRLEAQLWRTQVVNCSDPCGDGKALATSYFYGGEPMLRNGAHSSTEPANLALLAYDPRIQTEWFPAPRQPWPTTMPFHGHTGHHDQRQAQQKQPGAPPVLITPGPYTVSFTRANGNQPFISSHFPPGHDGKSAFMFNLVPAYVQLPSG